MELQIHTQLPVQHTTHTNTCTITNTTNTKRHTITNTKQCQLILVVDSHYCYLYNTNLIKYKDMYITMHALQLELDGY